MKNLFKCKRTDEEILNTFFGQIMLVFIGTTISIICTLGTDKIVGFQRKRENQRLSAMMVMSNIERFARTMDRRSNLLARNDSIATWLLSKPVEELELLPNKELSDLVDQATTVYFLSHDKSAESIFSSNMDTWKNIGNVQFIDRVGQCFSAMNTIEEYWNDWVTGIDNAMKEISQNPNDYEGSTICIKYLRNEKMRSYLHSMHNRKAWLSYVAATMRYHNRFNMEAIGIPEEEVLAFTTTRENDAENDKPEPNVMEFYTPTIKPDSLITFRELDMRLDSLKGL